MAFVAERRFEAGRDSSAEVTLLSVAQFPGLARVSKAAHTHLGTETLDFFRFLPSLQFLGNVSTEVLLEKCRGK